MGFIRRSMRGNTFCLSAINSSLSSPADLGQFVRNPPTAIRTLCGLAIREPMAAVFRLGGTVPHGLFVCLTVKPLIGDVTHGLFSSVFDPPHKRSIKHKLLAALSLQKSADILSIPVIPVH